MKFFILSILFFLSALAYGATIEGARYDSKTQTLSLAVVYQGGNQTHSYSLAWDSCQIIDGEKQIAARLIDTGWQDTGTVEYREVVSFSLAEMSCKPALLTVRSDRYSHVTLWVD